MSVSHSFSRAAETYDAHSGIQKQIADQLIGFVGQLSNPAHILEIGCGTGYYTSHLVSAFPKAKFCINDISDAMLGICARRFVGKNVHLNIHYLMGDAGRMHFPEAYDLVTGNSTLHWLPDIAPAIHHLAGCLAPGGQWAMSVYLRDSFATLRAVLQDVMGAGLVLPVDRFPTREHLVSTAKASGLRDIQTEQLTFDQEFDSLRMLLLHIRQTGVRGRSDGWSHFLTPGRFRQIEAQLRTTAGRIVLEHRVCLIKGIRS